jgi:VanZ family protein
MSKTIQIVLRWLPALFVMGVIFLFSAQAASELPDFNWADTIVKKGGHVLGYAILGMAYWRAFAFRDRNLWLAWLLTVVYAVSDEFHQSFVPGRHASLWDVLIFDNLGAAIALGLLARYKTKRPDLQRPVVENLGTKGG